MDKVNGISRHEVSHPWTSRNRNRVCAGRLVVFGRDEIALHVFTFGGDLEISSKMDGTLCIVKSTAPILNLGLDTGMLHSLLDERTIPMMLWVEVEVLLAKRRAAWADEPQVYQKSLSEIDPLTLYQSCLLELQDKNENSAGIESEPYHKFKAFLTGELEYLKAKKIVFGARPPP
jgi:hypothetical protein